MWCHFLFLLPLLGVGLFWILPWPAALVVEGVLTAGTTFIVVKSVQALKAPTPTGREAMIGGMGEAVSDLNPEGLVRVGGELWVAETREPVSQGARVQIVEVYGAKMRVRPWS